jgi:hypothetical protein
MAIVDASTPLPSGVIPRVRTAYIAGGSAGAHTLTGIQDDFDMIIQVTHLALTEGAPNTFSAPDDLTSEFTISDDDEIDNTAGTDSTGGLLIVVWYDADWGMQSDPGFAR